MPTELERKTEELLWELVHLWDLKEELPEQLKWQVRKLAESLTVERVRFEKFCDEEAMRADLTPV